MLFAMITFREIIDFWPKPSPDCLAAVIGANVEAVRKWRQRNSIPAEWWLPIVNAAAALGKSITLDQLAAMRLRQHRHKSTIAVRPSEGVNA